MDGSGVDASLREIARGLRDLARRDDCGRNWKMDTAAQMVANALRAGAFHGPGQSVIRAGIEPAVRAAEADPREISWLWVCAVDAIFTMRRMRREKDWCAPEVFDAVAGEIEASLSSPRPPSGIGDRLAKLRAAEPPPLRPRPAPVARVVSSLVTVVCLAPGLSECAEEHRDHYPDGRPFGGVPDDADSWATEVRAQETAADRTWTEAREQRLREDHADISRQRATWREGLQGLEQMAENLRAALDDATAGTPGLKPHLATLVERPAAWTTALLESLATVRHRLDGAVALHPWKFVLDGVAAERVGEISKALRFLQHADLPGPTPAEAAEPPKLGPKQRKALEYIAKNGPVKGEAIARECGVAYETFRRHWVPRLTAHGVANDQDHAGYYLRQCSAT